MRNFALVGASALILALGVGQAFAIPTTEQWQDHLSRLNPAEHSASFQDFRAQAADSFIGATVDQAPSLYHRGR